MVKILNLGIQIHLPKKSLVINYEHLKAIQGLFLN